MHRFIGEKRNALIDERERESGQSWETRVIVKEKYRLTDNLSSRNRGNRIPLRLISLLFVSLSLSLFNFSLLALENNARNPWFLVWNDSWGRGEDLAISCFRCNKSREFSQRAECTDCERNFAARRFLDEGFTKKCFPFDCSLPGGIDGKFRHFEHEAEYKLQLNLNHGLKFPLTNGSLYGRLHNHQNRGEYIFIHGFNSLFFPSLFLFDIIGTRDNTN